MTQRDNILKELAELQSTLATSSITTIYQVPGGYFDQLADQVLNRIRALETDSSREELALLSPVIGSIKKTTPYDIPTGYFEGLEKKLMQAVLLNDKQQTPKEELESLSPLLSGLKKEVPYSVPENYFESLNKNGVEKNEVAETKVISLTSRKWFRYAAAAVVIGFVALGAFLFLHKDTITPVDTSYAWVKKSMKQISTDELNQFIDMADEQVPVLASNTPGNDVKDLIGNISDDEIQHFLDDVKDAEPDSDDDILLN